VNQRMLNVGPSRVLSIASKARFCQLSYRGSRLRNISHHERRIRRRLDQHEAQIVRILNRLGQRLRITGGHTARVETERLDYLVNQMLAAAIQRLRIYERSPSFHEREHDGENRGHAGIEDGGGVGATLKRYQLLLEDFSVGMIQPRINQVRTIVASGRIFPSTIPKARSAASGLGNTKVELR